MRSPSYDARVLDASTFTGIVAGLGLLLIALLAPGVELLAVPALLVLLPSMLFGLR